MDPEVAKFRVVGLCAAPFQPFTEDGVGLDTASIAAHVSGRAAATLAHTMCWAHAGLS